MRANIAEMLKALAMGGTVDQLPPTDYAVDAPDGGSVRVKSDAAPVEAPQRRVVQSNRQTVSGDDNDERGGILDELSQGISVDERAALNDKRAGPDNTDMRQSFDRMENAFLTGAGLPSLGNRSNPYKDERNDMREWLGKRAGVAQNRNNSGLNAERTKAYLDATQSQRELGLRAQELRAEQEGRRADAEKYRVERQRAEDERKAAEGARKGDLDERGMTLKEKEFARKGAPKPVAAPGSNRKDATELRKEFNQLPDVKTFGEVDSAYQKVKRATENPSAAGDLSAVFAYMKLLDPGSAVKEGEFNNAARAAGADQRLLGAINRVRNGELLSPDQRADFVRQADGLYRTHKGRYDVQAKRYRTLAEKANAAPDDVTGAMGSEETPPIPAAAPQRQTATGPNGEKYVLSADGKSWEVVK